MNIKTVLIAFVLLIVFQVNKTVAQESRFHFNFELGTKIPIGAHSSQTHGNITYPHQVPYSNALTCFELGLNYKLSDAFMVGVQGGINGGFWQEYYFPGNSVRNLFMVPVYAKLQYRLLGNSDGGLNLQLNGGYNVHNQFFGYPDRLYLQECGGYMASTHLLMNSELANRSVYFKVGYEYVQNRVNSNFISYDSFRQSLTAGLGLNF